jgi:D-arabinose 1-dehydrogenase-like Zn-dependent alcohol dehydrogenase
MEAELDEFRRKKATRAHLHNLSCACLPCSYCHTIPTNLDLAGVAPLLCAGITTYAPYKDHGFDTPGKKVGAGF